MKTFLFITDNYKVPWGGSEELWGQTAALLCKEHRVSLLLKKWTKEPDQITRLQSLGANLIYRKEHRTLSPVSMLLKKLSRIFGLAAYRDRSVPLHEIKTIKKFDLVVFSMCDSINKSIWREAEYLNSMDIPYVLLIQLATDLRMVPDRISLKLKEVYQKAKQVYFLSEDNRKKTELILGIKLSNVSFVNNPFPFKQKYLPYQKPDYSMGCVASLKSFHKAQDVLIRVLSSEKWKKRNLKLNLYGDGVNRQQIERLIELYNLEQNVSVNGFETDKTKIWRDNILCIMPSRMEGQSLAMLEAMSYGRMIISTQIGDAKRLIKQGETGFLIDFCSEESIDETLEAAWLVRDKWAAMGYKSREWLFQCITEEPVQAFANLLITVV